MNSPGLAPADRPAGLVPLHDAIILYAKADSDYVRIYLLPQLRARGLRVSTLRDMLEPGVDELLGVERSLASARRVIAVVSTAFANPCDGYGALEHQALSLRKSMDVRTGRFSIIPAYIDDPKGTKNQLPQWLGSLVGVGLSGRHASEGMTRLAHAVGLPSTPER